MPIIKILRIIMLSLALVAGGLAVLIVTNAPAPDPIAASPSPPSLLMEDVLVAANDLPSGRMLEEHDFLWQRTNQLSLQPNMILRRNGEVPADVRGAYVRQNIAAGEPIRRERLIRPDRATGFLSANLAAGMRAIAVSVDPGGLNSAGGFVQPGDRVDVLKIARTEDPSANNAPVILRNVRVLAVGLAVERNLERPVNATNVTLEVTPDQAELLLAVQKSSQLVLALQPVGESTGMPETVDTKKNTITHIVRFGVITGVR